MTVDYDIAATLNQLHELYLRFISFLIDKYCTYYSMVDQKGEHCKHSKQTTKTLRPRTNFKINS